MSVLELCEKAEELNDRYLQVCLRLGGLGVKGRSEQRIIIECDGHDFHEKTKQQASRDKKRDRDLTTLGYAIYRFTGSEIFKNPSRCFDEVYENTSLFFAVQFEKEDFE